MPDTHHRNKIRVQVEETLEMYIKTPCTEQTLLAIKESVRNILLENFNIPIEGIDFLVEADPLDPTKVDIQAANLYTFMLFNNACVPYSILKDRDVCTYANVIYRFDYKEQIGYFAELDEKE